MAILLDGSANCRVDLGTYYYKQFVSPTGNALTVTAFIKIATNVDRAKIITQQARPDLATIVFGMDTVVSSGSYYLRTHVRTGTTSYSVTSAHALSTNTIYFVALKYDGSNLSSIVIDANVMYTASTAVTGNLAANDATACYIGAIPNDTATSAQVYAFNGTIDDVRIYTRALGTNELISINYGQSRDNIVNGIFARWGLNESYEGSYLPLLNTAKDIGPNVKHGTSEGGGYAMVFANASSQYVEIGGSTSDFQFTVPFTVMAWVKPSTTAAGTERIFSTRNSVTDDGIAVGRSGAKLMFTIFGVTDYITTNNYLTAGEWIHLAFGFKNSDFIGKDIVFFVNGTQVQLINDIGGSNPGTVLSKIAIGANGSDGSEGWSGSIDYVVAIKDAYASATYINWYKNELPYNLSNIKGLWRFSEGTGTSVADVSGNSHTGTAINSPTWEVADNWSKPVYAAPLAKI